MTRETMHCVGPSLCQQGWTTVACLTPSLASSSPPTAKTTVLYKSAAAPDHSTDHCPHFILRARLHIRFSALCLTSPFIHLSRDIQLPRFTHSLMHLFSKSFAAPMLHSFTISSVLLDFEHLQTSFFTSAFI